jgi:4-diphosphocytidyl-2-C-methyl-D-erythritol kinase
MIPGQIFGPAKLNLTLEVLAARNDGYHGIRSVVVPIALHDVLRWESAPAFRFTCSNADLESDDNLVVRTAKALGIDRLAIALHLDKNIPLGSGMGGGSSDAGALMRAAMAGAFGELPAQNWLAVAASIGSDVPLFLVDAPALIEGRGERVTALGAPPEWHAVIVQPGCHISTPKAYALLDQAPPRPTRPRSQSISLELMIALQRREFQTVVALLSNDFQAPISAQWPAIAATEKAFAQAGARAQLTGSGSALFTLMEHGDDAASLASQLQSGGLLPGGSTVVAVPFAPSSTWQSEQMFLNTATCPN